MAFLNDIDKKLTQFGQGALKKTKDVSESVRITGAVKEEENWQAELFRKMGEYFYQNYSDQASGEMKEWCDAVQRSKANVMQYQEQLRILKGVNYCPHCNAEVPANAVFCNNCGARIVQPQPVPAAPQTGGRCCPGCGAPLDEDQVFCMNCGMKVDEIPMESAPEEPTAAFAPEEPEAVFAPEEPKAEEPATPEVAEEAVPEIICCPSCGKVLKPGQKFCTSCGTRM